VILMNVFRPKSERTFPHPLVLAVNRIFGRYRSEESHDVRNAKVKSDLALEELNKLYREIDRTYLFHSGYPVPNDFAYERVNNSMKNRKYSAADLELFSISLTEFQDEDHFSAIAGLMLSALINNGKDTDYVIYTAHLNVPIDFLGYQNTKNIIVEGNVDSWVGNRMNCGTILVKGNAKDEIGYAMNNGILTVEGNAGNSVGKNLKGGSLIVKGSVSYGIGTEMTGGTITVNGNADMNAGLYMHGGEIHVDGELGSIGDRIGHGKIYHKGVLIVDK
jgi:hypothetical protein